MSFQSPGVPFNYKQYDMEDSVPDIHAAWDEQHFLGGITMKNFMASPATIDRKWYVVDAEGMTLGRLASEVAKVLRGKNKPIFTPPIDTG